MPLAPFRAVASYSEAAYFDGNHCHHVAAYEENERLRRIKLSTLRVIDRRSNGRARRF